jgi:hypothetical protein
MKSHEFLKAAADFFGGNSAETTQPVQPNQATLTPAEPQDGENPDVNTQSMVGPLQQKLELLKKAVDVDNMYDDPERAGGVEAAAPEADPVDDMKRLAGIMVMGGEDNDIVG